MNTIKETTAPTEFESLMNMIKFRWESFKTEEDFYKDDETQRVLSKLDPKDVTIILGVFAKSLKQKEIAQVVGLSQGAISRRIVQILIRAAFEWKYDGVSRVEVESYIGRVSDTVSGTDHVKWTRILVSLIMDFRGNQTKTGEAWGVSQCAVSYALTKLLRGIKKRPNTPTDPIVRSLVSDFIQHRSILTGCKHTRFAWNPSVVRASELSPALLSDVIDDEASSTGYRIGKIHKEMLKKKKLESRQADILSVLQYTNPVTKLSEMWGVSTCTASVYVSKLHGPLGRKIPGSPYRITSARRREDFLAVHTLPNWPELLAYSWGCSESLVVKWAGWHKDESTYPIRKARPRGPRGPYSKKSGGTGSQRQYLKNPRTRSNPLTKKSIINRIIRAMPQDMSVEDVAATVSKITGLPIQGMTERVEISRNDYRGRPLDPAVLEERRNDLLQVMGERDWSTILMRKWGTKRVEGVYKYCKKHFPDIYHQVGKGTSLATALTGRTDVRAYKGWEEDIAKKYGVSRRHVVNTVRLMKKSGKLTDRPDGVGDHPEDTKRKALESSRKVDFDSEPKMYGIYRRLALKWGMSTTATYLYCLKHFQDGKKLKFIKAP